MTTCLRHCLRRPLPTSSKPSINHRRPFSSPPLPSTFYVQRFHRSSEQYILLLPQPSLPMGRITLSALPPSAVAHTHGPIIAFVDPLPPELITQNWHSFVENAGFREVLQEVVRENIAGEEMLVNEARGLPGGDGWVHLCDERALPAFGRIPEPEDIIGSVLVKEGELQPETYQAMPTYRFVTRDGPMKLSPFLLERLRSKIRENLLGDKA